MSRFTIHRKDNSKDAIVAALKAVGVGVWLIGRPVDALLFYKRQWIPMEFKTPQKNGKRRIRKDQQEQEEFIRLTGCPVVTTADEAFRALGIEYRGELP
jgi:hypothetical protein